MSSLERVAKVHYRRNRHNLARIGKTLRWLTGHIIVSVLYGNVLDLHCNEFA